MTPQEKRRAAIVARFGSWEAYLESMRQAGSRGGNKSRGGGFAYLKEHGDYDKLKAISAKGGRHKKGKKHDVTSPDRSQRAKGPKIINPFEQHEV